jgi:hypothetical protein
VCAQRPFTSSTLNESQQRKRLKWCQQFSIWYEEHGKREYFSASCTTLLHDIILCIRMAHTSKHRPYLRVKFWGTMHSNGTLQLVRVNGMMTCAPYVTILQQTVVSFLKE